MQIVVTGAAGRLGSAVALDLEQAGHVVRRLTRRELDVANGSQVAGVLGQLAPDIIVNCSAYNFVDAAEIDGRAAYAVNALGPSHLAAAANDAGAVLIHFSTDFVFDGMTAMPYTEDRQTNPLNAYGRSKRAGEDAAAAAARHYTLRLESLFGGSAEHEHAGTIGQMIDALVSGRIVRAVQDRIVSPSYTPDVVAAIRALIETDAPYGLYHCVNSGSTSWFELACELARQLEVSERSVIPVLTTELATRAARPRFCALSNRKLREAAIAMPTWQTAIARHTAAARAVAAGH